MWCCHGRSLEEREAGWTGTGAHKDGTVYVYPWRDDIRLDLIEELRPDQCRASARKARDDIGAGTITEEFHPIDSINCHGLCAGTRHCESIGSRDHRGGYCWLVRSSVLSHSGRIPGYVLVDHYSSCSCSLSVSNLRAERASSPSNQGDL